MKIFDYLRQLLNYHKQHQYGGLGKEPYWNEPLPNVKDFESPRYVYADKFESKEPSDKHGRVIGYRISPTLVIHSMTFHMSNNLKKDLPLFIEKYGGKALEEGDLLILKKYWNDINLLRNAINDDELPKSVIVYCKDNRLYTTNIFDGRRWPNNDSLGNHGHIILKR